MSSYSRREFMRRSTVGAAGLGMGAADLASHAVGLSQPPQTPSFGPEVPDLWGDRPYPQFQPYSPMPPSGMIPPEVPNQWGVVPTQPKFIPLGGLMPGNTPGPWG